MGIFANNNDIKWKPGSSDGFTLIEVIIACGIMVILCVGTLTVFSHASRINTGNNLRAQAQSVLQKEAEFYRSLKFIPGAETALDLPNHRATILQGSAAGVTYTLPQRTSADLKVFNMTATVKNLAVPNTVEETCRFKEITITAVPATAQTGWLANLNTTLTIQRVRGN